MPNPHAGEFTAGSGLLSRVAHMPVPRLWLAYPAAVVAIALAAALRWWLGVLVGPGLSPFITFYPVVMLAALLGGAGPGLLATAASALVVWLFVLPPTGSLAITSPADRVGLALFCAINLAVTFICAALHTARHRTLAEARRAQASETRLRLAVETAELGTYERDLVTNQVTLNATCRAILGVSGEHLPADVAPRSLHPEDKDRVLAAVARAFDPNLREICAAEFRILRPDGSVRWVAGRGRVLFDDSVIPAHPTRFIGVLNDITERKRLQFELQHHAANLERTVQDRTAKLRETVAELEGFSYTLAHDMRAPLRAMLSYADIVELEAGHRIGPEHANLIRKIKLAARRMDQLVTDSLNYSKILRQDLPLGPVNLGPLLRGLIETYPNLQPHAASITVEIADLIVRGNPAALTQIFSNLLDNAVKFVAPGVHPRVRIWAQPFPSPPPSDPPVLNLPPRQSEPTAGQPSTKSVLVWVEDNGIGIPKGQQEKIFGIFERLHRSGEYPGTGIGLALVRKSLNRIGGQICLDSEPGKGSRFCVLLPLAHETPHTPAE